MTVLREWGRYVLVLVAILGKMALLAGSLTRRLFALFSRPAFLLRELYRYGVTAIFIMLLGAVFTGLVLGLQTYHALTLFSVESGTGALTALAVIRELGPVLAAILFASSAGAALTGELGLMRAGEELDALRLMAIDPLTRVVVPRFWANVISLPLLAVIFSAAAILAAFILTVLFYGVDGQVFWAHTREALGPGHDLLALGLKSLVFGFLVALISVYNGLYSSPTPAALARATHNTVVWSTLAILVADFMLTVFLFTD